MAEQIRKIGNFYKKIVLNNIGIFIFIGILSVVFHEYGWIPDKNMYAISQLVYRILLPAFLSFEAGRQIGGNSGGLAAVLAVSGITAADIQPGLLGALLMGPAAGFLWKKSFGFIARKNKAALQMLLKNLWLGILGSMLAGFSYFAVAPAMEFVMNTMSRMVAVLFDSGMFAALGIVIEPAKVFFLNNLVNHGILTPLGMSQVAEAGSSVLFLLETNPGPGLGMLTALFLLDKGRRNEYGTAMFTQAVGGLHEIYFPYVLSNFWLLLPLVAGGVAGNLTFWGLHAGLQGPASPGSIIIILLMAGREAFLPVVAGILISALTAFLGSVLVIRRRRDISSLAALKPQKKENPKEDKSSLTEGVDVKEKQMIQQIAVVCDGGVGTSSMGAAILRRQIAENALEPVNVQAFAVDLLPENVELIVCQKNFYEHTAESFREKYPVGGSVYLVESLLDSSAFQELVNLLKERNR